MDTYGNTTALVQLFAKPPVKGNVKTRLIPELGESIAADIYRYCLEYTLKLVGQSGIDYQLWLSEESEDSIFRNNSYRLQRGNDLGSRMLSAIKSELDPDGTRADLGAKYYSSKYEPLIINEIHYNPANGENYQFIEFYN